MKKIKCFLFFLLSLFFLEGSAQNGVRNIQAVQEGQSIKVTYDLISESNCNVTAFVSLDAGASWLPIDPINSAIGDIGAKIKPGNCAFVWSVTSNFENFTSDKVKFKIVAEEIVFHTSGRLEYSKNKISFEDSPLVTNNGQSLAQGLNALPNVVYQNQGLSIEQNSISVMGGAVESLNATLNARTYINGIPFTNQITGSPTELADPFIVKEISVSPQINSPENGDGLGVININLVHPNTSGFTVNSINSVSSYGGGKTVNKVFIGDEENFIAVTSNFTNVKGFRDGEFCKKNQYTIHGQLKDNKMKQCFFVSDYLFNSAQSDFLTLTEFYTSPQQSNSLANIRVERFGGGYAIDRKISSSLRLKVGTSWNRIGFGNNYSNLLVPRGYMIYAENRSFVHRVELQKRFSLGVKNIVTLSFGEEGQLVKFKQNGYLSDIQAALMDFSIKDSYIAGKQLSPFIKLNFDRYNHFGFQATIGENSNKWQSKYKILSEELKLKDEYQIKSPLNYHVEGYLYLIKNLQLTAKYAIGFQQPNVIPGNNINFDGSYYTGNLRRKEVSVKGLISNNFSFDVTLFSSLQNLNFASRSVPSSSADYFNIINSGIEFGIKWDILDWKDNGWNIFARGNYGQLNYIEGSSPEQYYLPCSSRNKLFSGAEYNHDFFSFGFADYWRSRIYNYYQNLESIKSSHEVNAYVSLHSKKDNPAFISLDLGVNNLLNVKYPSMIYASNDFGSLFPAPLRNYYANLRFKVNLSEVNDSYGGSDWFDLSNIYFAYRSFTANSNMKNAYGIGFQGHWIDDDSPVSTSTNIFLGLASNNQEFYKRFFAIPSGEVTIKGVPLAFSVGQNAELAVYNGNSKLSFGVGGSLNMYSVAEPKTLNYSNGYLFADKVELVAPSADFSLNYYLEDVLSLGLNYSKSTKIDFTNDDSGTTNYKYSERLDLSYFSVKVGIYIIYY